jgi:hypothetical protein
MLRCTRVRWSVPGFLDKNACSRELSANSQLLVPVIREQSGQDTYTRCRVDVKVTANWEADFADPATEVSGGEPYRLVLYSISDSK